MPIGLLDVIIYVIMGYLSVFVYNFLPCYSFLEHMTHSARTDGLGIRSLNCVKSTVFILQYLKVDGNEK